MEVTEFADDMTIEEKKAVAEYRANGLPGLVKIEESDIAQCFNLYMSGKTYTEIAMEVKKNKEMILYLSEHGTWHEKRMAQYSEIALHLADKIQKTKIQSADTIANLIAGTGKYINEQVTKFQKTNNAEVLKDIDSKVLTSYFKSIEALDKLIGSKGKGGVPNVNIDMTGNTGKTEIKEQEDGVEITTTNESGDTLSLLARYKKEKNK